MGNEAAADYRVIDGVGVITVQHPPVNVLSFAVRAGIAAGIDRALADEAVHAVVIIGGGKTFIAGADLTEFGKPIGWQEPTLHALIERIEACPKPVVAAIHGTSLGGGFELALACHRRVAVADAKVGLPEVLLGILPGAGGTQRVPRLTGVEFAIEFATTGRHVGALEAHQHGLIEEVVDDLLTGALAAGLRLAEAGAPQPIIARTDRITNVDPAVFAAARKSVAARARGAIAPLAIVDCIEVACTRSGPEGLAYETDRFTELVAGPQHAALKYYFFAEREARKIPGLPETDAGDRLQRVAIVGAGLMGGGIAMACANAGIEATLIDVDEAALARGRTAVEKTYAASVARGSMTQAKADATLSRIGGRIGYAGLDRVDLVIEAVFENLDLKKRIFAELDRAAGAHTILASNTSALDIDAIAAATTNPSRVVGMHFFSPANVMRLLENVRGSLASPDAVAAAMAFGKRLGKVTVLAGNCDGFIGNRMLRFYTDAADFMVEAGAEPEQIDRVAKDFGMAMGPFEMWDLVGIDTAVRARKPRWDGGSGERISPMLEKLAAAGRTGQKAGKGYYRYEGRQRTADPEAVAIIAETRRERSEAPRNFADEEIRDRLFLALAAEGARVLEDGTAQRASDIDVVWVNGYGFPAHKGGPMWWGAYAGLDRVLAMAERFAEENGPRWAPCDLLIEKARAGDGW